jgi:mono/diheme cytochrome c family protein
VALRLNSAYNSGRNSISKGCLFPTPVEIEEFAMSKLFPLLSVAVLLALTTASTQGGMAQASNPPTPEASAAPAGSPTVAPNTPNPEKSTPESLAKAKSLFAIDCALCHGDNGDGKTDMAKSLKVTLPNFTDPKTLADAQDWQLFNTIRNGKDKMPAEEQGRANNTTVWHLILYLRSLSKQ